MTLSRPVVLAVLLLLAGTSCTSKPQVAASSRTQPTLSGEPSWLPLGPEVYQEYDRDEAAKQILSFRPQPRWFTGFGRPATRQELEAWMKQHAAGGGFQLQESETYSIPDAPAIPRSIEELPLVDQDCRLSFAISPTTDRDVLLATLKLSAGKTPIYRGLEHRWTNTLPFLFAIFVDGKALQIEQNSFEKSGGAGGSALLVTATESRTWDVRIDAKSLRMLLPDQRPHEITLVAAFANSQHTWEHYEDASMLPPGDPHPRLARSEKAILVRSAPASISYDSAGVFRAIAEKK